MKKLLFVSVMIFGSLFSALYGKEYKLMDNGKACCQIIVPEGAIPAYSYAAEELSKYLGKISGSNKGPAIVKKKSPGMYGISLHRQYTFLAILWKISLFKKSLRDEKKRFNFYDFTRTRRRN